jgi:hypothetical protein
LSFEYLRQNRLKSNGIKSYVSANHHSTTTHTEKPWLCTPAHRKILDNFLLLKRDSSIGLKELVQFLSRRKKMTQAQTKGQEATKDQETAKEQTLQQHHEKAAEHHEQAAKHHKEAVKYYESGDTKTAAHHSYIAHGHTEQAREQEMESSKKYAITQGLKR